MSVRISKPSHSTHNSKDVIRGSVDSEFRAVLDSGVELELEGGVVDTGHVDGSTGLVFLGSEAEGVDVNSRGIGDVGVVLVGLDEVKVFSVSGLESVVAVELELGGVDGVDAVFAAEGVFLDDGDVEELVVDDAAGFVGVVCPFVVSFCDFVELDGPDELLDGVIEVES